MPDQAPCDCGCANVFSDRQAEGDRKRFRKQGPDASTKALIDALVADGVEGATLLDIGGGIGAIQLELLRAGAARAESVDASPAYVAAARDEAARMGFADRTNGRVGDFVAVAGEIAPADIVTLDKVVCCYLDMPGLLGNAADRARRVVGLVYPRETWWNRLAARAIAAFGWLTRDATRWRIHGQAEIDAVLDRAGFVRHDVRRELIWQISLYRRRMITADRTTSAGVSSGG